MFHNNMTFNGALMLEISVWCFIKEESSNGAIYKTVADLVGFPFANTCVLHPIQKWTDFSISRFRKGGSHSQGC